MAAIMRISRMRRLIVQQIHLHQQLLFFGGFEWMTGMVRQGSTGGGCKLRGTGSPLSENFDEM